ncbi:superoxide dismutase [Perkinsela sp. CCAP 1560/4]|nr:superoxide dismutase [Perkinsela sp. CCAP 1560/4]|eukprot:KNH06494.1 superoxide dismutase [Perkinsela sp. CCAP 1560/4]
MHTSGKHLWKKCAISHISKAETKCFEYAAHGRFQPQMDAENCLLHRSDAPRPAPAEQVFHLGQSAERFWGLHRAAIRRETADKKKGFYFLPKLDYPITAGVWPLFSAKNLQAHFHFHHREQLDALNARVLGTMWEAQPLDVILRKCAMDATQVGVHHAAVQHFNHCLFWRCLIPGGAAMLPDLNEAFTVRFGSIEKLISLFTGHCELLARHCGSGWVFLVWAKENFEILPFPAPGGTPLAMDYTPLLAIDMFEHSYMMDYGDDVAKYVRNFFRAVNWKVVHQWWRSCPR